MMTRRRYNDRGRRSRRKRGNNRDNKLDYEGNPVFKEVWTLGHSSPLPLLSLPISPIDGLQITQEGPTPPPLTGCNSRNKKNLMTLQRDGELSIVHALLGSSRGDAQPPSSTSHPSESKENRTQQFLRTFTMFRIIFFTIENTRLLFSRIRRIVKEEIL